MSEELTSALERFERVMGTRFPEWFEQLQPGLDDEGIERLRHGVAPLLLPAQVEQLYRWRSGGGGGVFGGWRLRTADELLRWYGQGKLRQLVSDRLPLERSVEAIRRLTDRQAHGKLVVRPGAR